MPTLRESIEAKYEILERVGQGGMGAVYKARHRLLDQERAIKVIRSPLEPSAEAQERFLREARVASRLRHPNLAVLHDFALADDGNAWLVLEWIDGITLREALRRHGMPPLPLSLEIARQACEALAYLHRQRIVHRDVSPGNLMLTRDFDGRPLVKLIDLGLAKALEGAGEGLTNEGLFLGKLRYASPEQFGTQGVDPRSDLYSLGIVLYEMLVGWCPIEGHDPMSWMAGHLFREPLAFEESDPHGKIPADLRAVALRMLAKKPDDRFGSAEELAQALLRIQARYPLNGDEMEGVLGAPVPASVPVGPAAVETPAPSEPESASLVLRREAPAAEESASLPLFLVPAAAAPAEEPSLALPLRQDVAPMAPEELFDSVPTAPRRIVWDSEEEMGDPDEPELLGPVQRPNRSWGALAAAALLFVAFLGASLWYQKPAAAPPPFAPPAVPETPGEDDTVVAVPLVEADPVPAPEPEIVEELPADLEPEPVAAEPEPAPPAVEEEPVQIVEPVRPAPAPRKAAPPQRQAPKTRSQKPPAEIAEIPEVPERPRPEPEPAPKRVVPAGPPADRMAGVLRPGPGVEMPVPLEIPSARYPAAARGRGLRERVHLDVLVDERGKAVEALVREGGSSDPGFAEAAVTAALATRFQPATRWDLPGRAWTELIFEFEDPALEPERGR